MSRILRELFPKDRHTVLIGSISDEGFDKTLSNVDADFFVANIDQGNNKKVERTDSILILPESDILPHINYTICVGNANDPNMIPTLGNASSMLDIPLVVLFNKPKEAYGSVRWVNMVKRCSSNLNVFLSEEISESWNLNRTPSVICDYTKSEVFTNILNKAEEDYYK